MTINLTRRAFALAGATAIVSAPAILRAQAAALRVGVTAGPHAQILEIAAKNASALGLNLRVVEFTDYIQPNAALAAGDLDANSYQHQPFLDQQIKDRGYKIVSIAQTVVFPIGIYSRRYKSLADVPAGGRIALPNDPTNGGRVLLLLQRDGLIKLRADVGLRATPADVIENPKRLRLIELDAAQLPRSLDDVDAAAVNTNFAVQAGLSPKKDAIAIEASESPYANVIAVREADRAKPKFATLVRAYRSPEVRAFVEKEFQGAVVATW